WDSLTASPSCSSAFLLSWPDSRSWPESDTWNGGAVPDRWTSCRLMRTYWMLFPCRSTNRSRSGTTRAAPGSSTETADLSERNEEKGETKKAIGKRTFASFPSPFTFLPLRPQPILGSEAFFVWLPTLACAIKQHTSLKRQRRTFAGVSGLCSRFAHRSYRR